MSLQDDIWTSPLGTDQIKQEECGEWRNTILWIGTIDFLSFIQQHFETWMHRVALEFPNLFC
jgi:hypothetical protein